MRYSNFAIWAVGLGLTLGVPLSWAATSDQPAPSKSQGLVERSNQTADAGNLPVYNPPKRGAPGGRVGGGTRGSGQELPFLNVLAPDHVGLTTQEQPTLYWYLSKPTTHPIELVIIQSVGIKPMGKLIEIPILPLAQPGIHRIRLGDYGVKLAPGTQYQWFVTSVVKPDRRSKDIIAGGFIERVGDPEAIQMKLVQAGEASAARVYAETGIWYDAVMALSEMIDAAPNDPRLRRQRAALMQQVGLPDVAEFDLKYPTVQ